MYPINLSIRMKGIHNIFYTLSLNMLLCTGSISNQFTTLFYCWQMVLIAKIFSAITDLFINTVMHS